jgi:hypothetical protein
MNVKVNNSSSEFKPPAASTQAMYTVSTAATTLATLGFTYPAGYQYVYLQVQANPVRITYDTTTPSATVGESVVALSRMTVRYDLAKTMKFIREGGADGTLFVQPFGV